MPAKSIEEVLEECTRRWMVLPGVAGVAIGQCEGAPCIKVFLAKKTKELGANFPSAVEGHPVVLEESGEFRAL